MGNPREEESQRSFAPESLIAAYDGAGRSRDALKLVSSLLESSPYDVDLLFQRACLYVESGANSSAELDLNGVLSAKPRMAGAHYVMARIRMAQGMKAASGRELRECVRLAPSFLRARVELALYLTENDGAREALSVLELAPIWQKSSLTVVVQRNWALIKLQDWRTAKKSIEEGLAIAKI